MIEQETEKAVCPTCSARNVRVVNRKNNYRPWPQTGNLRTDLTPVSITLTYQCQNKACGHEWTETCPHK